MLSKNFTEGKVLMSEKKSEKKSPNTTGLLRLRSSKGIFDNLLDTVHSTKEFI